MAIGNWPPLWRSRRCSVRGTDRIRRPSFFASPTDAICSRERIMENAFSMYRRQEPLLGQLPMFNADARCVEPRSRLGLNVHFCMQVGKSVIESAPVTLSLQGKFDIRLLIFFRWLMHHFLVDWFCKTRRKYIWRCLKNSNFYTANKFIINIFYHVILIKQQYFIVFTSPFLFK